MKTKTLLYGFIGLWIIPWALTQANGVRMDAGVERALATQTEIRVLIMLDPPAAGVARLRPAERVDALLRQVPALGPRVARRFQSLAGFAARIDSAALAALRTHGAGLQIGLDPGGVGSLLESIPLAQVDNLHLLGRDGSGQKVAILDSGLRLDHLSFSDRVVDQACFCTTCCPNGQATQTGSGAAADDHGHGTNVSGIAVGGDGVSGVPRGVASAASIVAIKVLDKNNSFCCASDVIAGYDWLLNNHPDATVVNASLATFARFVGDCDTSGATFTQAFAQVIGQLRALGMLATVASGNEASSSDMSAPACVSEALSVGAVYDSSFGSFEGSACSDASTAADKVRCFSNLSTTTDLLAPGSRLTAAGLDSTTATSVLSGTSMAAPMVAGCIALLREAVPGATADAIEAALEASPTRLSRATPVQSYPRLDCADALRLLEDIFDDGFEGL